MYPAYWALYSLVQNGAVLRKVYHKNALRIIPNIDKSQFQKDWLQGFSQCHLTVQHDKGHNCIAVFFGSLIHASVLTYHIPIFHSGLLVVGHAI